MNAEFAVRLMISRGMSNNVIQRATGVQRKIINQIRAEMLGETAEVTGERINQNA
ncbi:hypothetical protein PQR52_10210 [Paraburkholderia aspalathi]|uniref:hypothetical protein n=1 Tax=Paraburkholderia aspalathi TaxID=1324617 RepID=UPI0038B6DD6F